LDINCCLTITKIKGRLITYLVPLFKTLTQGGCITAQKGFKRKLAAILSADVEGYSRLMDDDEEATVRTITSYRNAIADIVQQFRGGVVDTPGDNILTEFTSVVDAVICAVEIQFHDLSRKLSNKYVWR
jgi:class 3 adenylate cyclase